MGSKMNNANKVYVQNVFFDQANNKYGLHCGNCGESNLHHYQTEIFNRSEEDSDIGNHIIVGDQTTVSDSNMKGNPSTRRDGIAVRMWCEHCDSETTMEVSQHKGSTYLALSSKKLTGNRLTDCLKR